MAAGGRRRAVLAVLVALAGCAAVVAGAVLTVRLVREAERDLLRAEAQVAAQVWAETGVTAAVEQAVPGRWRLSDSVEAALDEPVVRGHGRDRHAAVAVYDAEGWEPVGKLTVDSGAAAVPTLLIAASLFAIVLLAWSARWWVHRGTPFGVVPFTACLVLGLGAAGVWTHRELARLSTARLSLAVRALEAVRAPDAVTARPGGPQRLTGLPFMLRDATGVVTFSALPTAVTEDLPGVTPGPDGRAVLDRTPYRVAQVQSVTLAFLPYEHVHAPWGTLLGLLVAGVALAAVPTSLRHFVDQPRVLRRNVVAWSFLAPALLHLAVFTIGPLLFAGWLSLHRWSLIDAARPFVALGNYAALLTDGGWWNALANTAVFTLHVPVSMAVALGLALLTRGGMSGMGGMGGMRGAVVLRAIFFLPTITSLVAIAIVWQWMLHDEVGILNWVLGLVGIGPVPWLSSPRTALPALMLMAVWLVVGYQMVLFQAGLAAIPKDLYDAARMDGAGPWRRFLHVTIPGLRHTLFFVLVTSVIGSFQIFGAVYVMTEGGPLHSTDVAVFHIYEEAWEYFRFGSAAAMSWMLFAIIFAVTWVQFRVVERRIGTE